MYDIAEDIARWLAAGESVQVAQLVETQGFSSRDPAAALAWTDGASVGVLPGIAPSALDGRGLIDVTVADADAVASGLSCGGVARVVVQDAAAFPADVWPRLARREPLCIVHDIGSGATRVYTAVEVRDAADRPAGGEIPRLFARGTSASAVFADELAVVTLWPPTALLVVGDGNIADALAAAAGLLEWTAEVTNDAQTAGDRAAALTPSDAVVVLSHDRAVDVPALAAALSGRAGYIGGLGARHTQAARRDGLLAGGIDEAALARIHGPAGLDIDAHTPAEIAVSITAEILASRSGASGGPISGRDGPVHVGGVHAPPPRY
jgi:xanthine dehydrogenase accessory factor